MKSVIFLLGTILVLSGCEQHKLTNTKATKETKMLYDNLFEVQQGHIMFGHHDTNAYGHDWKAQRNRSDVDDVCGSFPAVYGHDFSGITLYGASPNYLRSQADSLRVKIVEAYNNGAVNTITWHFYNPAKENSSFYYEKAPIKALPMLLPGAELHSRYKDILKQIAIFAKSCKGAEGELVPMIFRPFHEYDGEWFWWGVPFHASEEEFKQVWRFTHSYLTDSLKVNNFIYAISPDCRFSTEEEFLSCYPGDEWVDMIAMDNYWDLRPDGGTEKQFVDKLEIVSNVAKQRGKVAALSETGLEGIPVADWWTGTLLRLLKEKEINLSYVMVWRNATDNPVHHYAPYPGHISADDFVEFRNDPYVLFRDDIENIYSKKFKIVK